MSKAYTNYKSLLEGEYLDLFERAEVFAVTTLMPEKLRNQRMDEVADLLLTAQREKKPLDQVVGRDQEGFCHAHFDTMTLWERLLPALDVLSICTAATLILAAIHYFGTGGALLEETLRYNIYLIYWPFTDAAVRAALQLSFRRRLFCRKRAHAIPARCLSSWFFSLLLAFALAELVPISLPAIPVLVFCVAFLLFEHVARHIFYREPSNSPWIEKNLQELLLEHQVDMEMQNFAVLISYAKQYRKECARREKHGRAPISQAQFFARIRCNLRNFKRVSLLCILVYLAVILCVVFENRNEFLANGSLLLIVLIPSALLVWFFWYVGWSASSAPAGGEQALRICEESGLDLLSYEQMLHTGKSDVME